MPVYAKGERWRVVIYHRGVRMDRIVTGSRDDAEKTESVLRDEIEARYPAEPTNLGRFDLPPRRRRGRIGFDPTFVYFVKSATGEIKIGRSDDPEKRFDGLRTSSPVELTLVGYVKAEVADERALHERFKAHRLRGEWFAPDPEMCEHIADLLEAQTERDAE